MTLAERARTVQTREDFTVFLHAFCAEARASQASWANADLSAFLVAMSAWSEDMDGYYEKCGEDVGSLSPWRVFADILMAARVYE